MKNNDKKNETKLTGKMSEADDINSFSPSITPNFRFLIFLSKTNLYVNKSFQ